MSNPATVSAPRLYGERVAPPGLTVLDLDGYRVTVPTAQLALVVEHALVEADDLGALLDGLADAALEWDTFGTATPDRAVLAVEVARRAVALDEWRAGNR